MSRIVLPDYADIEAPSDETEGAFDIIGGVVAYAGSNTIDQVVIGVFQSDYDWLESSGELSDSIRCAGEDSLDLAVDRLKVSKVPGCKYVHKFRAADTRRYGSYGSLRAAAYGAAHKYRHTLLSNDDKNKHVRPVYVVLKYPVCEPSTITELQVISQNIGPVFVSDSKLREFFSSTKSFDWTAELEEYDMVDGDHEIRLDDGYHQSYSRVNYNPKAIERRKTRQKNKSYEKRMRGSLPNHICQALMSYLSPSRRQNISDHPYGDMSGRDVLGPKLSPSGWQGVSMRDFDEARVVGLIRFNKEVCGSPFWRNLKGSYYCGYSQFDNVLAEALNYVHGIEAKYKPMLDAEKARIHNRWQTTRWQSNGRLNEKDRFTTYSAFYRANIHGCHANIMLYLARWLRKEAKAIGIAMPPKPVKPPDKRKKKTKAKKRKTKSKSRRKSVLK